MDCQVYFNDPEENGSDAGKENLFEAEYEWIGDGGNRTHDANDTKDLIISGPSFLSIAARNSNASGDSELHGLGKHHLRFADSHQGEHRAKGCRSHDS